MVRTRVKRRLRHLLGDHVGGLPAGTLLVLRAQPAAAEASSADLGRELTRGLARLGLLREGPVPA